MRLCGGGPLGMFWSNGGGRNILSRGGLPKNGRWGMFPWPPLMCWPGGPWNLGGKLRNLGPETGNPLRDKPNVCYKNLELITQNINCKKTKSKHVGIEQQRESQNVFFFLTSEHHILQRICLLISYKLLNVVLKDCTSTLPSNRWNVPTRHDLVPKLELGDFVK